MGVWDPGLPRWMDPMDIFGYSNKTMDDLGAGVVKQATTASGSRSTGKQSRIPFPASKPRMRGFSGKRAAENEAASQRVAQKLRSSWSQTETKTKSKPKKKMPRRLIEAYGNKYKPKFKTVKVGPLTSRMKLVNHVTMNRSNALYAGFNDVGPPEHHLRVLAEAFLMFYMKKVGEYRSSRRDVESRTWGELRLEWRLNTYGAESTVADSVLGHTATGEVRPFLSLSDDVRNDFQTRIKAGYELAAVKIYATEGSVGGDEAHIILYDPDAGRHTYEFEANAKFKIQNTTDADHAEGTLAENIKHVALGDKNNIHANPIDGLVYRFRNAVPKWAPGFLTEQSDAIKNQLNDLSCVDDLATTGVSGVHDMDLSGLLPYEFKVPPPAPYTLFTNCSGRSKIYIKPGEFKVLKLKEHFSGSINAYCKRYMPVAHLSGFNYDIPPGGNCYLIGLKPTLRTSATEDLEVQCETERYYAGVIKARKLTATPILNLLS